MKKQAVFFALRVFLVFTLLVGLGGCEKDTTMPVARVPTLLTAATTGISQDSAISGGTIVSDGGASITARGVCWFPSENPTIGGCKTSDGTGTGIFTSTMQGLFPGKRYHVRAYAINSAGIGYGQDIAFTATSSTSLSLGDTWQGGIIFYVRGTYPNQFGLVCAPHDQGTGIPWNSQTYVYYGTTGTGVGSGQANTSSLVGILGNGNYAAGICDELVLNGFDDWFLPSRDEMGLMFSNLKKNGFGNFSDACYWSSSEYDSLNAFAQYFSSGRQSCNNKIHRYSVRAVRVF